MTLRQHLGWPLRWCELLTLKAGPDNSRPENVWSQVLKRGRFWVVVRSESGSCSRWGYKLLHFSLLYETHSVRAKAWLRHLSCDFHSEAYNPSSLVSCFLSRSWGWLRSSQVWMTSFSFLEIGFSLFSMINPIFDILSLLYHHYYSLFRSPFIL